MSSSRGKLGGWKVAGYRYLVVTFIFLCTISVQVAWNAGLANAATQEPVGFADLPIPAQQGAGANWISADGRYILVASNTALINDGQGRGTFLRDRVAQQTLRLSNENPATHGYASMTNDLRYAVVVTSVPLLSEDQNGTFDVYVEDRQQGLFELASVSSADDVSNGISSPEGPLSISDDGRYVVFKSLATNLYTGIDANDAYDVFIRDRQEHTTTRLSTDSLGNAGDGDSGGVQVNSAGTYVTFHTDASDIDQINYPGKKIFTKEINGNSIFLASAPRGVSESEDTENCQGPTLSADGRFTSFTCMGKQLVPGVTNNLVRHAYRFDRQNLTLRIVDIHEDGQASNVDADAGQMAMSGDGRRIVFVDREANMRLWDSAVGRAETFYQAFAGQPLLSQDGLVFVATLGPSMPRPSIWLFSEPPEDNGAPSLGLLVWSQNPKPTTSSASLTVPASDDLSGIMRGEYFIEDVDPGQGNGVPMDWDGTNLSATFGNDLSTGVYKVNVRVEDNEGNWSQVVTDYLVVYDPSGPMDVVGRRSLVPSLANGDILPGLNQSSQSDKMIFGFDVKYGVGGVVDPASAFGFTYNTGSKCNTQNPVNCHETGFTADSFNWLTIGDVNNSLGTVRGVGTLTVDGVNTQVRFSIVARDGDLLTPVGDDTVIIKIFNFADDPDTATPIYKVSAILSHGSSIKIQ